MGTKRPTYDLCYYSMTAVKDSVILPAYFTLKVKLTNGYISDFKQVPAFLKRYGSLIPTCRVSNHYDVLIAKHW